MDFSTEIQGFNREYNLNAINEYNKYLKGQASFDIEVDPNEFARALEEASRSAPLRDKNDTVGMGSLMDRIGNTVGGGLNAVNNMKIEANRMQEDIARGGSTDIHAAMIAAEKADLSLQMAIQVRNRILSAYTEISSMGL